MTLPRLPRLPRLALPLPLLVLACVLVLSMSAGTSHAVRLRGEESSSEEVPATAVQDECDTPKATALRGDCNKKADPSVFEVTTPLSRWISKMQRPHGREGGLRVAALDVAEPLLQQLRRVDEARERRMEDKFHDRNAEFERTMTKKLEGLMKKKMPWMDDGLGEVPEVEESEVSQDNKDIAKLESSAEKMWKALPAAFQAEIPIPAEHHV